MKTRSWLPALAAALALPAFAVDDAKPPARSTSDFNFDFDLSALHLADSSAVQKQPR